MNANVEKNTNECEHCLVTSILCKPKCPKQRCEYCKCVYIFAMKRKYGSHKMNCPIGQHEQREKEKEDDKFHREQKEWNDRNIRLNMNHNHEINYGKYEKFLPLMDQKAKDQFKILVKNAKHCKGMFGRCRDNNVFWEQHSCPYDQHKILYNFLEKYTCSICKGWGSVMSSYDDCTNCYPINNCDDCNGSGVNYR